MFLLKLKNTGIPQLNRKVKVRLFNGPEALNQWGGGQTLNIGNGRPTGPALHQGDVPLPSLSQRLMGVTPFSGFTTPHYPLFY